MAYQTGTYSGVNNALDLLRAWFVAQGWTVNSFIDDSSKYDGAVFTGKRLHVQKTIGETTCYFNFRSAQSQQVFEDSQWGDIFSTDVTGICVNGSTGYNAGNTWDYQPGATVARYTSDTDSSGGCADALDITGGDYFFFATGTTVTAVFTSTNTDSDYRAVTVGVIEGRPMYASSGGGRNYTGDVDRSAYMMNIVGANVTTNHMAFFDGTAWCNGVGVLGNITYSVGGLAQWSAAASIGSNAYIILLNTPEPFRGNAQLVPISPVCTQASSTVYYPLGTLEGTFLINMENYSNEAEVTLGSSTYKLFNIRNGESTYPWGMAFLK